MSAPHRTTDQVRRRREILAAAVMAAATLVAVVLAFVPPHPFASSSTVRAVFASSAQIRPDSEVRVAGLKVGRVRSIGAGPRGTSLVTIELDDNAPTLRNDARMKLRPRLALEGNAYIDVRPGTPTARALPDGGLLPFAQTGVAVQMDQAISMFDAPTRASFQRIVHEIEGMLGATPPDRRAPRAGSAELRLAGRELAGALPTVAVSSRAIRGERNGDLPAAIRGTGDVTRQLTADPSALIGLINDYARVSRTLAEADAEIRASVSELGLTMQRAPAELRSVLRGLPALTRFARLAAPASRVLPAALRTFTAATAEVKKTVAPGVLPRTLDLLAPILTTAPDLMRRARVAAPQATAIGTCLTKTVVPALNKTIEDGKLSTGQPIWQEALHMAAGLAGAASSFDANGGTLRLGITEGEQSIGINLDQFGQLAASIPSTKDLGLNPTWLGYGANPTWRPDARCDEQALPDFGARRRSGVPPGWRVADHAPQTSDIKPGTIQNLLRKATPLQRLKDAAR